MLRDNGIPSGAYNPESIKQRACATPLGSWAVAPRPKASLPITAAFLVHPLMSRRGVKGSAHESHEIAQLTAERLASKHGVRLDDGVQVIYPTARKLNPFIPRCLSARQCAAARGLF